MSYTLKRIVGTETEHQDYALLVRRVEEALDKIRQATPTFRTGQFKIDDIVDVHDCDPGIVPDVALMYGFRREICPFGIFYSTHSEGAKIRANGVWLPMKDDFVVSESDEIVKCDCCSNAYHQGRELRDSIGNACGRPVYFPKAYKDLNQ